MKRAVRTGLAVVDGSGVLVDSPSVRTDDEIDAGHVRHSASAVSVAIDVSLIVKNETGMRPAEKLMGASFGRYDASCYAADSSNPHMNRPWAANLALRDGWNVDLPTSVRPNRRRASRSTYTRRWSACSVSSEFSSTSAATQYLVERRSPTCSTTSGRSPRSTWHK